MRAQLPHMLVHAHDPSGPLLVILADNEMMPDYAGFEVVSVEPFENRALALAALDRARSGMLIVASILCPVCSRPAAEIGTPFWAPEVLEYTHAPGGSKCYKSPNDLG